MLPRHQHSTSTVPSFSCATMPSSKPLTSSSPFVLVLACAIWPHPRLPHGLVCGYAIVYSISLTAFLPPSLPSDIVVMPCHGFAVRAHANIHAPQFWCPNLKMSVSLLFFLASCFTYTILVWQWGGYLINGGISSLRPFVIPLLCPSLCPTAPLAVALLRCAPPCLPCSFLTLHLAGLAGCPHAGLTVPHWPDLTAPHWPGLAVPHQPDLTVPHWPGLTAPHWASLAVSHWVGLTVPLAVPLPCPQKRDRAWSSSYHMYYVDNIFFGHQACIFWAYVVLVMPCIGYFNQQAGTMAMTSGWYMKHFG